jgi:hypothetical protein
MSEQGDSDKATQGGEAPSEDRGWLDIKEKLAEMAESRRDMREANARMKKHVEAAGRALEALDR